MWSFASLGIGLWCIHIVGRPLQSRTALQFSLWLGVFLLALATTVMNFFTGLQGSCGAVFSLLWVTAGFCGVAVWIFRARLELRYALRRSLSRSNSLSLIVVGLLLGSVALASVFATAEPMDADAGIYRMGSINYAAHFPVIPGLANIHDRFGFNSILWPVSALFENGLWAGNGFRIVTGLFFTLLIIDCILRVAVPRRRMPGDFFLLIAVGFLGWVSLNDTGRWIPSPAQDVVAAALFMTAIAYLLDAVAHPQWSTELGGACLMIGALAGATRPLGWLLVPPIVIVLACKARMCRVSISMIRRKPTLWFAAGATIALLLVMLVRDAVISGWLFFPFDRLAIPVDWIAPKPTLTAEWITAYARLPGVDANIVLANSDWIRPWISSFANSRETRVLGLTLVAVLIPLTWLAGRRAWRESWSSILLCMFPPLIVACYWFVAAPDLRFGWGPLLGIAATPVAFLLANGAYPRVLMRTVFVVVLALGLMSNFLGGKFAVRGGERTSQVANVIGLQVPLELANAPHVDVVEGHLADGTKVLFALHGGCYNTFPLCLLPDSGSRVKMRGEDISEGFQLISPLER